MACHVFTALEGIRDFGESVESMQGALMLSCWTEDLDVPDYQTLSRLVAIRKGAADWTSLLLGWVLAMIPKYKEKWLALDQPADREEWNRRLCGRDNG